MRNPIIIKPNAEELTGYVKGYVDEVIGSDLLTVLRESQYKSMNLYLSVPSANEDYSYAPGKWTVKEVLGHVVDTERIFAYRALTFARGDRNALPGFEENDYVPNSNAANRTLPEIINEYELVRKATIALFDSFSDEMLDRKGTANNLTLTPRIVGWMMAGHDVHHSLVIAERYLGRG